MYRLRDAERKVYIYFDAHPISGVFFVCLKQLSQANVQLDAPVGVLFVFRGKPSNMSQTENSAKTKGEFIMIIVITKFLKNERGDAYEEIKKQNIIYGT